MAYLDSGLTVAFLALVGMVDGDSVEWRFFAVLNHRVSSFTWE